MIRAVAVLLTLICYSQFSLAQDFTFFNGRSIFSMDTAATGLAGIKAEIGHSSNAITNETVDKLLFGGEVTDDLKKELLVNSTTENRFGATINAEVSAVISVFNRKDLALSLVAAHSSDLSVKFSKDALRFSLYGNSAFGNETIIPSPLDIQLTHLQKIGFGIIHKPTASFVRLNIYHGNSIYQYRMKNSNLKTSFTQIETYQFAEELAIATEVNILESATSTWGRNWGVGIDAQYSLSPGNGAFGNLTAALSDFGALQWREINATDTSGEFLFRGWDQLPGNGNYNIENLIDSITPTGRTDNQTMLLPAKFALYYFSPIWQQWYASASASHRLVYGWVPKVEIGIHRVIKDVISVGANASYGGFADFSVAVLAKGKYKSWYFTFSGGGINAFSKSGTKRYVELSVAKTW